MATRGSSASDERHLGPEDVPGTLSTAVREHLRKLCLREFPCGVGSWNKSRFLPRQYRTWRELIPKEEETVGPEEETVEALLGLVRSSHSPWAMLKDSSAEDRFLRELAIQNPLTIKDTFFYSYFRCLRVVDKGVSLVDKEILKFLKLEELVLSANKIKDIDANNLPPTLKGNPLALVPYYRGFTVDSLARLCVLDDITVSPSEKHQFRGLNSHGDLLAREAQFVVTIGNVRGVLDSSILDPEPGPDGPFISYSYYVTYDFVEDEEKEGITSGMEELHPDSVLDEIDKPSSGMDEEEEEEEEEEEDRQEVLSVFQSQAHHRPVRQGGRHRFRPESPEVMSRELSEYIVKEMNQMAEDSGESGITEVDESETSISIHSAPLPQSIDSSEELAKLRPRLDVRLCPSPGTVLFSTMHKPWADVIPCTYEMKHTLKELIRVKAFLLSGTTVSIVEEKIISWPVVPTPVESPLPAKKGKGDKKKKEEPAKDKGPRKKKEPPRELRQDPPVLRVLGSGQVYLEPLLAGEPVVSTVCNFGVARTLETDRLTYARDSKKVKKGSKKDKSKAAAPTVESGYQPEPLSVEVQIQLHQYRSVEEAFLSLID
uniref:Leucine rich repeat containing 43 n=1 Tax=Rattus norvegicus TaxID=10116 RepID=F7FJD5_RAT